MAESAEGGPIGSEKRIRIPRESTVPDAMLHSIEADAPAAFSSELEIMRTAQPDLRDFLLRRVGSEDSDWYENRFAEQYMRGALLAYRILRSQATQDHTSLPQVSSTTIDAYEGDTDELVSKEKELVGKSGQPRKVSEIRGDALFREDMELDNAVRKLTRFEVSSVDARYGAYDVLMLLNKESTLQEMEKMLAGPEGDEPSPVS